MRIRLSCLLLFFSLITFGQQLSDEKITIEFSDIDNKSALEALQAQTPWRFSYNPDAIPDGKHTQSYIDKPIGFILNEILGKGFEYKIRGSYLIIQRRHDDHSKETNQIEVSGQIVDSKTGDKIENVSIYEVNNLTAALSREDGSYHLAAQTFEPFTILAISKEHYKDTLITVSSLTNKPIVLSLERISTESTPTEKSKEETNLQSRFSKFIRNQDVKLHNRNIELEEERIAQISFLPVLGSNGVLGGKVSNKTSLNVIAGYSYGTNGVEVGGVLNMNRKNMIGTQIGGVSNLVGERMDGVQIAGVTNTNFTYGSGLQLSGVMNSSGAFHGAQIAGTYNYVKYRMSGFQLSGTVNYAGELNGVQLGVVNIAKKVDKGIMIGLINVAFENGIFRFELDHNDLTDYNISLKTGTKIFHNVFTAGISPGPERLWSYGLGFGSQVWAKRKESIWVEATNNTIQSLNRYISGLSMDNRLNIAYSLQFKEHLSIKAGPVVHYYLFSDSRPKNEAFYESIGFTPFAQNTKQKAWIGYQVGIRF